MADKKYLDGDGVAQLWQATKDYVNAHSSDSGYNPSLSVGRADALTGRDETAQWAQRESTGSGTATVRSVQGAAVAWAQMLPEVSRANYGDSGIPNLTVVDGALTGTITGNYASIYKSIAFADNHKYMQFVDAKVDSGYIMSLRFMRNGSTIGDVLIQGNGSFQHYASSFTAAPASSGTNMVLVQASTFTEQFNVSIKNWMLFDLTQMFGSGNEPTTVAEFEQMYPASYYPYSAPTLKPVQIAGIASTDAQGGELDAIEWAAQTLRAAGSVCDELTADKLVTRVGVVDLGTLTWNRAANRWTSTSLVGIIAVVANQADMPNITVEKYKVIPATGSLDSNRDAITVLANGVGVGQLYAYADDNTPSPTGLMFYELATPTTTPISPALPMTYRVEQGGSESIIVPDGEVSAAPVLTVAEGESAADVVMDALAAIAAPDGPTATANHAINTYLTMGGKLYKVTTAIAAGETITAGTNVTQTTVMDELIALTQ